jgi:hypothetical protein
MLDFSNEENMVGRSGLIAGLIATMLAAPLCPLVCAQLRMSAAHNLAPAPQGSCHQKSVPAGDPVPDPDADGSPVHSCERCTHLQQAVKSAKWTSALDSVSFLSGCLDHPVSRLSACQPIGIEQPADPPASPPGIEPILRI